VDYSQSHPACCWIHGAKRQGDRGCPLIDPATGEVFAESTIADGRLVDAALKSSEEGLIGWRSTPATERARIMHGLADAVRLELELFAALVSQEVGKPLQSAREEVSNAASLFDYFAEESMRLAGHIPLMGYSREHVLIVREPVGVVVAITPFNYPMSTLACKMGPALSVGCTMVAKPDEHTPLSTLKLAETASRSGLPPGVFNVVTGPGTETGRMLVDHPLPRLITFTGSSEVGKEIQVLSSKWVRKVVLELGGNCAAIVCRDAPWEDFLPRFVSQCMKNTGQYCYRISRAYVAEEVYDDFLGRFVKLADDLRVGHPREPGVDLGPLNNGEVLAKVQSQVDTALREGARLAIGGKPLNLDRGGFYYPPTVLTGVRPGMSILREEVFGPVAIVSPFEDVSDAVRAANDTPYGLAAYVFSKDLGNALDLAGQLEVGSVWINRMHQAYPEAPFGGMKESGLGREKSRFGLEEFTEMKTIYLSY